MGSNFISITLKQIILFYSTVIREECFYTEMSGLLRSVVYLDKPKRAVVLANRGWPLWDFIGKGR